MESTRGREKPRASGSRSSARVNQRASSSSALPRGCASRAAVALKPSIRELGNGQGCEEW